MLCLFYCFLRVVILVNNGFHALDRWAALRSDSGAVWAVQLAGTVGMPCSSLAPAGSSVEALQTLLRRAHLNTGFRFCFLQIQGRL